MQVHYGWNDGANSQRMWYISSYSWDDRMQDLNDIFYFSQVVTHGGFAAAGRALNIPKSKLSRRVAQLEVRMGARLIERSSRRFRVTEIGRAFYDQCQT